MLKKQQRPPESAPYAVSTPDAYANMNGGPLNLMILNQEQGLISGTRALPLPSNAQYSPELANGFNELDTLLHDLSADQYANRIHRPTEAADGPTWVSEQPNKTLVSNGSILESRIREQFSPGSLRNFGERKNVDNQPRVVGPRYDLINDIHSNPVIISSYSNPPGSLLPSKPTIAVSNPNANGFAKQGTTRSIELESLMASLNELDPPISNHSFANMSRSVLSHAQNSSVGGSPNSSLSSSSSMRRAGPNASPSSSANWTSTGGRVNSSGETSNATNGSNSSNVSSGGNATPKRSGSPHVSFADDLVKVIPLSASQPPVQPSQPQLTNVMLPNGKPSTLKKTASQNGTVLNGKPPNYVHNATVPPGTSPIVVVQNSVTNGEVAAVNTWPASNGVIGRIAENDTQIIANGQRQMQARVDSASVSNQIGPRYSMQTQNSAGHIAPAIETRLHGAIVQSTAMPINGNLNLNPINGSAPSPGASSASIATFPSSSVSNATLPPPPAVPVTVTAQCDDAAYMDDEIVYDTLEMYQFGISSQLGAPPVQQQRGGIMKQDDEEAAKTKLAVKAAANPGPTFDDDIPLRVQPIFSSAARSNSSGIALGSSVSGGSSGNSSMRSGSVNVGGTSSVALNGNGNGNGTANAASINTTSLGQVESRSSGATVRQPSFYERETDGAIDFSREGVGVLSLLANLDGNNISSNNNNNNNNNSNINNNNNLAWTSKVDKKTGGQIQPPAQYQAVASRASGSASTQLQSAQAATASLNHYSLNTQQYSADSLSLSGSIASSRQFDPDRDRDRDRERERERDQLQSSSPTVSQSTSAASASASVSTSGGSVTCETCGEALSGRAISAMGKFWHPEHFRCTVCHETIGTQRFFERVGEAFCELCYLEQFAPRCAHCDQPVHDKCVSALGKSWHYEHFACAACNCLFDPTAGFLERDGRAYCIADFYALFGTKCAACERPIGPEAFINAFGKQYHRACWKCAECGRAFDASCSFCELDGRPVCDRHFTSAKPNVNTSSAPTSCAKCTKPIATRCVTALSRKYHPECFTCTFCMRPLVHDFRERDAKPYCSECYSKLVK